MRLLRFFDANDRVRLGLREKDDVIDVTGAAKELWGEEVSSPLPLIATWGNSAKRLKDLVAVVRRERKDYLLPLADLRLDAPLRDAPKLLALAGNYRQHVVEGGLAPIEESAAVTPQIFSKPVSTTINAPGAPIVIRPGNIFLDWEIELAVILGGRGRDIPAEEALSYVFGYTLINDISERRFNSNLRDRKAREFDPFFDWLLGKWFDGAAPLGPELVTADEVPNPHHLRIRLWVNDQLMQDANTSEMIHSIPEVISYISKVMTIEPGDILAMGTPAGVGMARGISLKPGDRVRGEIEGLGVLENPVR